MHKKLAALPVSEFSHTFCIFDIGVNKSQIQKESSEKPQKKKQKPPTRKRPQRRTNGNNSSGSSNLNIRRCFLYMNYYRQWCSGSGDGGDQFLIKRQLKLKYIFRLAHNRVVAVNMFQFGLMDEPHDVQA